MERQKLKDFLDKKTDEFNTPSFISEDPVFVPHLFSKKQDIEIAGFFAAIFAWGIRKTIISKGVELMKLMDSDPYNFIKEHSPSDLRSLMHFRHRTFNTTDLLYFVEFLHHHYSREDSLETAFFIPAGGGKINSQVVENGLNHFRTYFVSLPDFPSRTGKHIASPLRKSTCKRLNMFLRWMVRKDNRGVDFGIWKSVNSSQLICPVDLHVARVARRFKMFERKQVDWLAALEITSYLRTLDLRDPVKYDFALFGLGIMERY